MAIHEMSANECRVLLGRASLARLGCSLENQPYVVPISIAFEEEFVYSFSTLGQKIEWMRMNPKVCVQVDEIDGRARWLSVIVNGSYEELREPQFEIERAHAKKLLEKRHNWWLNALAERQLKVGDDLIAPLFFRIRIESLTGLDMSSDS